MTFFALFDDLFALFDDLFVHRTKRKKGRYPRTTAMFFVI
jgi:hypothetical protein